MKVSVVVPAYNARPELKLLLASLNHCELCPPDSFEVVVADDGSTDGTRAMVESFPSRYELSCVYIPRTPNSGRAAARNAAIARASGDLVVMVDADQIVPPGFLAEHLRFHALRSDLVVTGPRWDLGDGVFDEQALARRFTAAAMPPVVDMDIRERVFTQFSANYNNLATCWHLMFTCNVSVRREHLLAAGGFDEGFLGWGLEDAELGYRLRRRGFAFAFNQWALAYHQRGRGVDARMYGEWRRNLNYMVGRHGTPELAIQSIMCRALDPADRGLGWLECMSRFEYAARALAGRLPGPVAFELVEVDDANAAEARQSLPERALAADLIVVDTTERAELAGPVQCADSPRELLYYHQPSAAEWERIRTHHHIAVPAT